MAETYASSLEQSGSHIFWAASASKNHIVIGADASNAFTEADPPKIPLYVRVNEPYQQQQVEHMKRESEANKGQNEQQTGMQNQMKMPNMKVPSMKMPKM